MWPAIIRHCGLYNHKEDVFYSYSKMAAFPPSVVSCWYTLVSELIFETLWLILVGKKTESLSHGIFIYLKWTWILSLKIRIYQNYKNKNKLGYLVRSAAKLRTVQIFSRNFTGWGLGVLFKMYSYFMPSVLGIHWDPATLTRIKQLWKMNR